MRELVFTSGTWIVAVTITEPAAIVRAMDATGTMHASARRARKSVALKESTEPAISKVNVIVAGDMGWGIDGGGGGCGEGGGGDGGSGGGEGGGERWWQHPEQSQPMCEICSQLSESAR